MEPRGQQLLSVAAYLALMTLWVYAVVDRQEIEGGVWLAPLLVLAQLGVGFAVRSWWAVLLPLVVVLVSVPAMDPPITPDSAEPFPIFFSLLFAVPIAVPMIALGVGARKIRDGRQT
jgi:hypothetical protein